MLEPANHLQSFNLFLFAEIRDWVKLDDCQTPSRQKITKYEGEDVTFICKAVGDSMPHFKWIILNENGSVERLDPGLSDDEYLWESDDKRWHGVKLRLVNVKQEDSREYLCMVGDDYGYSIQTFSLNVLERPVTTISKCLPPLPIAE